MLRNFGTVCPIKKKKMRQKLRKTWKKKKWKLAVQKTISTKISRKTALLGLKTLWMLDLLLNFDVCVV